jgi:hypothetical protein
VEASEEAGVNGEAGRTWDSGSVEASTQAAIVLDSRRRIALPRAIRAAKLTELASRDDLLAAREEELENRRGPAVEGLRQAEKALAEAREAYRKARGEHDHLVVHEVSDLRNERRQMLREKNSVESEPVQPRGLAVFSVWHENNKPNPDDPGLSGDSPATAWGVANVADKPLSEGTGEANTMGGVPTKALKQHASRKK